MTPLVVNQFFEDRLEQIFDLASAAARIFERACLPYRVIGGLAVYLYVEHVEPDAGRLTRDLDILVRRQDLARIAAAANEFGFELRHAAGLDMLVRQDQPSARRAINIILAGEKVRPEYPEPAPSLDSPASHQPAPTNIQGLALLPLPALVRMKLTSFRAKDEAHLKDLDEARLITPEIEAALTPELHARLIALRARP